MNGKIPLDFGAAAGWALSVPSQSRICLLKEEIAHTGEDSNKPTTKRINFYERGPKIG